jgi:hypothetical protein
MIKSSPEGLLSTFSILTEGRNWNGETAVQRDG